MNDRILASAAVILCSYVICSLLILPVRAAALRFGILDSPGERKLHSVPVPRLGGLAIYVGLVAVVWGSLNWLPVLQASPLQSLLPSSFNLLSQVALIKPKLWALFAGGTIVTIIGFLDDIYGVHFSPYIKLAGQALAASILLPFGIYIDLFTYPWLGMLLSVVWIVGITNSFNLLDNMDGLSSGIAIICSALFLTLVMLRGEFFIALLISAVIGSTLGFWQFNMRRGLIFMGDNGSLLLGYLLGAISLMARYVDPEDAWLFPVLAPVIILGLPLFDTFSVIFIRLREGRPLLKGDQMHLSHRLVKMGMTRRQAVYFNYLISLAIGINALLMVDSRILHSVVVTLQVLALVAIVTILMAARQPSPDPDRSDRAR